MAEPLKNAFGPDVPAGIGGKVRIEVEVENVSDEEAPVLIDLRPHFVKANGSMSPKVFKGAMLTLEPGGATTVRKTI